MTAIPPGTPRCTTPGCAGVEVESHVCLAHVDPKRLPTLLSSGTLDLRGATVPAGRAELILGALPTPWSRPNVAGDARFDEATFEGRLELHSVDLHGRVSFRGTRFCDEAAFVDCAFQRDADFTDAVFESEAAFIEGGFSSATFERTRFCGTTRIGLTFQDGFLGENAVFEGWTTFLFLRSGGRAGWPNARFRAPTSFAQIHVDGELDLDGAIFEDSVEFKGMRVQHLSCYRARFNRGSDLGGFQAEDWTDFREAVFEGVTRMGLRSQSIDLRRALFSGGATILVERAFVVVGGASFQRASTISRTALGQSDRATPQSYEAPRLGSLDGADVGKLTLDGLDLRRTRFAGAHGLAELRFVGDCQWLRSPGKWWQRRTVYDEHQVRDTEAWKTVEHRPEPEPLNMVSPIGHQRVPAPQDVAEVYRALRKGREDAKDASGASDFYVGEMEMRRQGEKGVLLPLYGRVSGYGTRARRSALAFLVFVAALVPVMRCYGVDPGLDWERAASFTLASTVYLARLPADYELTTVGDVAQLLLRTVGPLLLGLTLLALRSRVKR